MKSEIEFAIYLAKRESKKLMEGFDVLVNLKNFLELNNEYETKFNSIKKLYGLEGSANVRFVGLYHSFIIRKINNVGLYPFKNE
jgi:hypothetical protein